MLVIIKAHNRLNGLYFSVIEFALIALLVGVFAGYYLLHQQWVYAAVSGGIALNCLPVVALGLGALAARKPGAPPQRSIWDKTARPQLIRDNPHMQQDTLVLTFATLLPYVSLAAVVYELWKARRS